MPPNLNINGFPRNVKCCYLVPQKTTGGQYGSRKQWKTSTTIPYPPAPCKNSFDFCFFFSKEFLSPGCHLVYKTILSALILNGFWSLKFKVSSKKIIYPFRFLFVDKWNSLWIIYPILFRQISMKCLEVHNLLWEANFRQFPAAQARVQTRLPATVCLAKLCLSVSLYVNSGFAGSLILYVRHYNMLFVYLLPTFWSLFKYCDLWPYVWLVFKSGF